MNSVRAAVRHTPYSNLNTHLSHAHLVLTYKLLSIGSPSHFPVFPGHRSGTTLSRKGLSGRINPADTEVQLLSKQSWTL